MSCHLSCPTCQNKFFKISNMSAPNSKRDLLKSSRPSNKLQKTPANNELENVRHENEQLEIQNRTLKKEVRDIMLKNDNLIKALNLNKERFEEDFNKLQDEIRQNENHLVENSRKCLDQQKKYAEEVKKLKQENENLKKFRAEVEKSLSEKLKGMQSENKLLQLENENLLAQIKENEQKSVKYKTKLRHAVKIVNEMNHIVALYRNKPEITCGMTQTDTECIGVKDKTSIQDCSQCGDPRYKRDLNSENLILSDIFFKPKSFLDSETELFTVKSKQRISSKTGF